MNEIIKRYMLFIVGLFVNSLGICLIIKADLGSSPISSLPYTVSLMSNVSLGTLTFILNLFLIAGQMIVLKKDFKQREWLQLPVSVLFGVFIDFSMMLLGWIEPTNYIMKLLVLVLGCAVLGLGVSMEVIANVVMLSGEAFVQAISLKKHKEFGLVKIGFDTTLMILAIVLSLVMSGRIVGVREGTVVAAFLVGMFARYYNIKLEFMNRYLSDDDVVVPTVPETGDAGKKNFIITIAREYGSGGREIGRKLAEHYNIAFYDKELIEMSAKENGLSQDYVAVHEQNIPSNLLYEMVMQDYTEPIERSLSFDDALFVAQSRIIRKLASERSCVIVGRCADYILRDFDNCFKVFVHADYGSKLKRIIDIYGETRTQAIEELKRVDRGRANHCKTYTNRVWGDASNYDLCIDSSSLGVDGCCQMICYVVDRKLENSHKE